jgi:large subunit ribosomal protein L23
MSELLIKPRISEKAIALADSGTYVFEVPTSTNKIEVAKAIEKRFKVHVENVNIMVAKGKTVHWRTKGKRVPGRRADVKKAFVTLKKGEKLTIFEEGSK